MFRQTLAAAASLLLLCGTPCGADDGRARERITDFSAEVAVQADASLLVTERITVNAEHEAVKHGIYRAVPALARREGRLRVFGADSAEALLDGEPTPCRVERGGPLTIFILGDPDKELARGEHEFTLTYRATGHVRREDGGYVLRYDATGGAWTLPVEAAAVLVTLPEGAEATSASAHLVRRGMRTAEAESAGDLLFASPRPLEAGEALIVRAAWRGGAIAAPEPGPRERIGAHGPAVMTIVGALPLLCFVLLWLFRRRADRFEVRPLSAPPRDFPPGLIAHVVGLEANSARADLLWTAARGFLRLERRAGTWRFLPSWPERPGNARDAWQDEACLALAHGLFADDPGARLPSLADDGPPRDWRPADADDGARLFRALSGAQSAYRERMRTFVSPSSWVLPLAGVVTNAVLLYAALYCVGWTGIDQGEKLNDHMLAIVCCSLIAVLPLWWLRRKKGTWKKVILPLCAALSALALGALLDWNPMFWLPVLSCVFTPPLFWLLFPETLTPRGLEARAVADGLALTLGASSPKGASRPESLLPYAAALGLSDAWEQRFAPVLAAARRDEDRPDDRDGLSELSGLSASRGSDSDGYAAVLAAAGVAAAAYGAAQREAGGSDDWGSDGGDGGSDGGGGDSGDGGGGGGW